VRVLYIEADEDHVALQNKKKGDEQSKAGISMPKLVYLHEGIDAEKSSLKGMYLKNVRYFGGDFKSEDLWLKVAQYIDESTSKRVLRQYTFQEMELHGFGRDFIGFRKAGLF
jgi:hypothetical protein